MENCMKNTIGKTVWEAFCDAYDFEESMTNEYVWKIYETSQHNKCVDKNYAKNGYDNTAEDQRIDNLTVKSVKVTDNTVRIYAC